MTSSRVVVDTNTLVSLLNSNDSLHSVVIKKLHSLESSGTQFFLNTLIVSEICTVVLFRSKDVSLTAQARKILVKKGGNYGVVPFEGKLEQLTYQIFESQNKPQLSVADCSIIAQAKLGGSDAILTLDAQLQVAAKKQGLKVIG